MTEFFRRITRIGQRGDGQARLTGKEDQGVMDRVGGKDQDDPLSLARRGSGDAFLQPGSEAQGVGTEFTSSVLSAGFRGDECGIRGTGEVGGEEELEERGGGRGERGEVVDRLEDRRGHPCGLIGSVYRVDVDLFQVECVIAWRERERKLCDDTTSYCELIVVV